MEIKYVMEGKKEIQYCVLYEVLGAGWRVSRRYKSAHEIIIRPLGGVWGSGAEPMRNDDRNILLLFGGK
jgi:hypothetical protein